MSTTKKPLSRKDAADTICAAVIAAAGCGGHPDGPDLMRAAAQLTRDAIATLQDHIRLLSFEADKDDPFDWPRVEAFWERSELLLAHPDGDYAPEGTEEEIVAAQEEAKWVAEGLSAQASLVFESWDDNLALTPFMESGLWTLHSTSHLKCVEAADLLKAASLLILTITERVVYGPCDEEVQS